MSIIYHENVDQPALEGGFVTARVALDKLKKYLVLSEDEDNAQRFEMLNEALAEIAEAVFDTATHPDPQLRPKEKREADLRAEEAKNDGTDYGNGM